MIILPTESSPSYQRSVPVYVQTAVIV